MLGVDVLVAATVAVSVRVTVGVVVADAEVGVSLAGRNGVLVGLPDWMVGVFITGMSDAPQLVTITLVRTMLTNNELILIPVPDLHLHFPNGLQQRTALLEPCFPQVA
jgi:hypothetical protein